MSIRETKPLVIEEDQSIPETKPLDIDTDDEENQSIRETKPLAIVIEEDQSKQVVAEQEQDLEQKPKSLAPRRLYPHVLTQSALREICHFSEEDDDAEAKVMYLNPNFGKGSLYVCHEELCPLTDVCKEHNLISKMRKSIAMQKYKSRMARTSARLSILKNKLRIHFTKK